MEVKFDAFLTLAVVEMSDQLHALAELSPEKQPPVCIG
jgi:hypothetical protein